MKIDFENKGFTHGSSSIKDNGSDYTINYVSIPVGTKLYHGNNFEEGNDILVGDLKYFLINPDHAEDNQYGIMHKFETTIPLNLIRLDDKDTQEYLYETSNKEIQKILKRNFGYKNGIRDSEKDGDATVAERICELSDYHGYLTDVMTTDMGGKFHPEIVICNPSDKLNFVETVTPYDNRRDIIDQIRLKLRGIQEKKLRKKNSTLYDSPKKESIDSLYLGMDSPEGPGLFGKDTPPHSPAAGPGLFGKYTPPHSPDKSFINNIYYRPGGKKSKKKNLKKKGNKRKTKRKSSKNKRKIAKK